MSAKPSPRARNAQQPSPSGRWANDPLALPNVRGTPLRLPAMRPEIHDDAAAARKWLHELPRPWAVDLFSGCGGLGLGLERAGLHVVAAADSDAAALETYAANLGSLTWRGDLADPQDFLTFLSARGIDQVDVIAGGPPCQPFSRAGSSKIRSLVASGSRTAVDERVDLWQSFTTVIDALTPRAVLIENVPDMATWDNGSVLLEILRSLRQRGYATAARVLQAERFGVPQHRQRLFVVARRRGTFAWPDPEAERVDLRDAIGDLPVVDGGQRKAELNYAGANTAFQRRARVGVVPSHVDRIYDHVTRGVREDDAEAFDLLMPGQTYRDLPDRLKRYRDDIFDDKYKRLAWRTVSRSITAHIARDGYWYIHPDQARTLSIREAARIQTFPDSFRFSGHPSVQYRQIGNAVPPALGQAVAAQLRATLDSDEHLTPSRASTLLRESSAFDAGHPGPEQAWRVAIALLAARPAQELSGCVAAIVQTPRAAAAAGGKLSELLGSAKAQRIVTFAATVNAEHDGRLPRDEGALRRLPGIGKLAAGRIRAFGFGEETVIASEATRRVVGRVTGLRELTSWTVRLHLLQLSGESGPDPRFNHALLSLAENICTAAAPRCDACPLRSECAYPRTDRRDEPEAEAA